MVLFLQKLAHHCCPAVLAPANFQKSADQPGPRLHVFQSHAALVRTMWYSDSVIFDGEIYQFMVPGKDYGNIFCAAMFEGVLHGLLRNAVQMAGNVLIQYFYGPWKMAETARSFAAC